MFPGGGLAIVEGKRGLGTAHLPFVFFSHRAQCIDGSLCNEFFPVRGTRSCITILLNVITFPDYEDIIRSVTKHKYPYLLHVWDVVSTKYKGFVRIIEGIRSMIIIRG